MIKISPSILSADFSNLLKDVKEAEAGGADLLHIDVMDGHFVPNITIGPLILKSLYGKTKIPFDVHLMIMNPDNYIKNFAEAGAEIITVHAEACNHLHRTIHHIKEYKIINDKKNVIKAGVSINPHTPLNVVENILEDIDMLLIMSVNPGFGGQKFIKSVLPKIRRIRKLIDKNGLNLDIEIDGGISEETGKLVVQNGANILVAGNAIFKSPKGIKKAVEDLRKSVMDTI